MEMFTSIEKLTGLYLKIEIELFDELNFYLLK